MRFCNNKVSRYLYDNSFVTRYVQVLLLLQLLLAHYVSTFWLKDREDFTKGDISIDVDDTFMVVDDMTETIFNSRGPRSLYRGLEEMSEIGLWGEADDYEDF